MSNVWETTVEDVWGVLRHYGGKHDYQTILNMLDHDRIKKAALCGSDKDKQTNNVFAEIERQLRQKQIVPLDGYHWHDIACLNKMSKV